VFEPMLSEEYQTREGLGRTLAYWLSFKRFGIRDFLSYVERFGHPIPIVSWKTGREAADETDVDLAELACKQLGIGTSAGAAIPDTLTIDRQGSGTSTSGGGSGENTPHKSLIAFVDEQISKLVLGQAQTTNKNQGATLGSKGDQYSEVTRRLAKGYAQQIEGCVDSLVKWIVRLNFGDETADALCPHYSIQLDDDDNTKDFADTLATLAGAGLEIPSAWVADRFGIPARQGDEPILGSAAEPEVEDTEEEDETPPDEGAKEDEES
jgi:phage gp29-like protein